MRPPEIEKYHYVDIAQFVNASSVDNTFRVYTN